MINNRNQRLSPKYNFGEKKIIKKNKATEYIEKYKNYRENGKQLRGNLYLPQYNYGQNGKEQKRKLLELGIPLELQRK